VAHEVERICRSISNPFKRNNHIRFYRILSLLHTVFKKVLTNSCRIKGGFYAEKGDVPAFISDYIRYDRDVSGNGQEKACSPDRED
jgi:hypothetical protein